MVKTTIIDHAIARMFPRKSLDTQIAEELENHVRLSQVTQASLRRQQFDLHMTLSRIAALKAWTEGRIRTPSDTD